MMANALIVEQLDGDGTLKTLRMRPGLGQHIVVAFSHEYAEPKEGPFHFLEPEDERRFQESFASCRARPLSKSNFRESNGLFYLTSLRWAGIPTEANALTYYALSLPQFAVPRNVSIVDPRRPNREYRRSVRRDDDRNRYVVYLECASSFGRFDFELNCEFTIDQTHFNESQYKDPQTTDYPGPDDFWEHLIAREQTDKIKVFFEESTPMKSNPWVSGSFYLTALLSVLALLLAAAKIVNFYALPIVIIGGFVAIGVIGALQLRNDTKLSEKSFLQLMTMAYRQLPFIGARRTD